MGLQLEFLLVVALVISCCGTTIQARISKRIIFFDGLEFPTLTSKVSVMPQGNATTVAAHGTGRSEEQLHASGALCEMCEQYSTQALSYLNQNDTQTEIISLLYDSCAKLEPLKQQCITLVDYYVPLFFTEVAAITPDELCDKLHLCKETNTIRLPTSGPACKLCHKAVLEILTKLQDPSTQVDIVAMLTKACTEVKNDFPKCYDLVSQYAPEVMNSAEAFLEKTNICASVCKADVPATKYIFTN